MQLKKLGPIIYPDIFPDYSLREFTDYPLFKWDSVCGPSVYKTPDIFNIGKKYVMYFAHHSGTTIRSAFADHPEGPWHISSNEILPVNSWGNGHIASPDCVIYDGYLEMYYHTIDDVSGEQLTFSAKTSNGVDFYDRQGPHGQFYFRNYFFNGEQWAIAKYKNYSGILYKKNNKGGFAVIGKVIRNMRHASITYPHLFYSKIGDSPESIYYLNMETQEHSKVLEPTEDFELYGEPSPSKPGRANDVTAVRDPFYLDCEDGRYLYYCYGGENGIAVAKL